MAKLHYNSYLPRLAGHSAITIGQHVFFDSAMPDHALVTHELYHVKQYRELGLFRFWARYLKEYVTGRLRGLSHQDAYLNISLEREARAHVRLRAAKKVPNT